MRAKKGGNYERELCKLLSLWWTNNKTDDVFWRTAGSGGRATGRAKKGMSTHGSYGDILAVNPIGAPLLDLFTIEVKRGYPHYHIGDLLDVSPDSGRQKFEEFFDQVWSSWSSSGSFSWMIVTRRDKRDAFVYFGRDVYDTFVRMMGREVSGEPRLRIIPIVKATIAFRVGWKKVGKRWVHTNTQKVSFVGMSLSDFLKSFTPALIIEASRRI